MKVMLQLCRTAEITTNINGGVMEKESCEICEAEGCNQYSEFRDPMGNKLCSDCIQQEVGCGDYTWDECEVLE